MTCESVQPFLHAYVDRELDAANTLRLGEHLSNCDACSSVREKIEALRSAVASEAPRYRAPEGLRGRIQSDLRKSAIAVVPRQERFFHWKWTAVAAGLVVTALALWQTQVRRDQREERLIASEIVSSHVRSLMANHLLDEPSSDQHTVKPWFAGKLDFSPAVKNLDAQGFVIAGGRLDYIGNRSIAAIVYRRRQHVINLFVWPSSQTTAERLKSVTVNGFNIVDWTSGGMRYSAVSDLNKQELELFYRLWSHE